MDVTKGTRVTLVCGGAQAEGTVLLCSPNQESLLVQLDEGLWTAQGLYWDIIPLSMIEGQYRELVGGELVEVAAPPDDRLFELFSRGGP